MYNIVRALMPKTYNRIRSEAMNDYTAYIIEVNHVTVSTRSEDGIDHFVTIGVTNRNLRRKNKHGKSTS